MVKKGCVVGCEWFAELSMKVFKEIGIVEPLKSLLQAHPTHKELKKRISLALEIFGETEQKQSWLTKLLKSRDDEFRSKPGDEETIKKEQEIWKQKQAKQQEKYWKNREKEEKKRQVTRIPSKILM